MKTISFVLALFSSLLGLAGCRGSMSAVARGNVNSPTHQELNDNSRTRVTTSVQWADTILNLAQSQALKAYREDLRREPDEGFSPNRIIITVNGVPLRPGTLEENRIVVKRNSETGWNALLLGVINGNRGSDASVESPLLYFTVRGTEVSGLERQDGRPDRAFGITDMLRSTNLDGEDPPMWIMQASARVDADREYEGRINLQSKGRDEIIRKFKLVVGK